MSRRFHGRSGCATGTSPASTSRPSVGIGRNCSRCGVCGRETLGPRESPLTLTLSPGGGEGRSEFTQGDTRALAHPRPRRLAPASSSAADSDSDSDLGLGLGLGPRTRTSDSDSDSDLGLGLGPRSPPRPSASAPPDSSPRAPARKRKGRDPVRDPGLGVAGCRGLEPLASGVTGGSTGLAAGGQDSQPGGIARSGEGQPPPNSPALAPFRRPFGIPLVSSPGAPAGEPERLLTVREVARSLSVAPSTVYALCARGQLPHARVANAIRVSPRDVAAYLASADAVASARRRSE